LDPSHFLAVYQEKFYADSKNVVIILVVCAAIYRSEYQLGLGGAALCSAAEASRDNRLAVATVTVKDVMKFCVNDDSVLLMDSFVMTTGARYRPSFSVVNVVMF